MNAYTVPVDYVDLNSPVEVVGVRVEQTPGGNFCFVTLRNLDRLVLQVRLNLYLFDAAGRALGPVVDALIRDVSAPRLHLFGGDCPIQIGGLLPTAVRVEVKSVVNDNGQGINQTRNIVPVLPPQLVAPQDMKYLHKMAGKDAVNLFSQSDSLWRCVCGRTNAVTQEVCMRCGRDYGVVETYDINGLLSRRAIEQRAEQAAMPAPVPVAPPMDSQALAELSGPKKKKVSTGAVFVILMSVLVLFAAAYFSQEYGLVGPGRSYKQGITYFEQGRYAEARDCFEEIQYKDSEQMTLYAEGFDLANRGKRKEAAEVFEKLGEYKDAVQRKDDFRYEQMQLSLNNKEYYEALEMMRLLEPSGKVNPSLYNQTIFNAAGEMQRRGEPEIARALYMEISSLYSVSDQIKECDYQMGVNAQDLRQYERAIQIFSTITPYRDSSSRMQESKYNWAKQLAEDKQYKAAVDLFGELRYFRDSKDLFNETCYQAGKELVAAGDKAGAQNFFNMIPDYKDASSYVVGKQEYDYRNAVELRGNQKYKAAAEAFLALGDYRDSAQLAVLCEDDALNEGSSFTDLKAVMHKLQELGTYGDASDRLSNKKYVKIRLAGSWKDNDGNAFSFTLVGDTGYYIRTEIPMYEDVVSSRFNGYVYEISRDGTEFKPQFEFISLNESEIVVYNYTDNVSYTLRRQN